ncbi:hypothetical protein M446_3340 [Methylobacterium sp. 4-46]|nr:hypothetical protein M446_3340 [Methylobacterium sp. 4-46]
MRAARLQSALAGIADTRVAPAVATTVVRTAVKAAEPMEATTVEAVMEAVSAEPAPTEATCFGRSGQGDSGHAGDDGSAQNGLDHVLLLFMSGESRMASAEIGFREADHTNLVAEGR